MISNKLDTMSRKMNLHYLILFACFAAKLPFLRDGRLKLVFPLHEFTVKDNNKTLHMYEQLSKEYAFLLTAQSCKLK